ncbi:hypothetical protein HMPREF9344_00139 [Cutibacterium acnes HL097PA1]|nr:hypothetical protein HMPREF9344_00139 [Cutibacterium acnes HL097PA1]
MARANTGTTCIRHYMKGEQGESTEDIPGPRRRQFGFVASCSTA